MAGAIPGILLPDFAFGVGVAHLEVLSPFVSNQRHVWIHIVNVVFHLKFDHLKLVFCVYNQTVHESLGA